MYDKDKLKDELTLDEIKTLLTELGAQHIETHLDKGHIITNTICHNISDGKMKLYYYFDDTEKKGFHCYTACSCSFDIYELIISNHALRGIEMNLRDAILWTLSTLGKTDHTVIRPKGFGYDGTRRRSELDWLDSLEVRKPVLIPMKEHSDRILDLFSKSPHPLFLDDGISAETMKKFEVCYYEKTNRIVIPHRHHCTGRIIGLKTRSLDFEDIDRGYKYIPFSLGYDNATQFSFPSFQNLYAYYQNKENIKRYKKVMIFESEKSCLKMESLFPGRNISVAICGSNISKLQVEMLLELGIEEVIICMDKEFTKSNSKEADIYQEKIERMCRMFSSYVKVSMVWDRWNLLELKDSPIDKGAEVLSTLIKKRKLIGTEV